MSKEKLPMPLVIKEINEKVKNMKKITNEAVVKINDKLPMPILKFKNIQKMPMPLITGLSEENLKKIDETNDEIIPDEENKKCAPNIEFVISCYPLNVIISMVKEHNKLYPEKEIPLCDELNQEHQKHYKMYLVQELEKHYGKIHKKWLNEEIIKNLDKDVKNMISNDIFRPRGPTNGSKQWLNSLEISKVMHQYETLYSKFVYLATVPRDFYDIDDKYAIDFDLYKKNGNETFAFVINTDKQGQGGSHWKMLFFNVVKGAIYYIDSAGAPPEEEIITFINYIKAYLEKNNIPVKYSVNDKQYQFDGYSCGVYSMFFINALLEMSVEDPEFKKDFVEELKKKEINDKVVHEWRRVFFSKY